MLEKLKQSFKRGRKGIFLITYGLVLYYVLGNLGYVASALKSAFNLAKPLLLGICIAFVANIGMTKIEKLIEKRCGKVKFLQKNKRGISLTLTLLLSFLFVVVIFSIIMPHLVESIRLLITNFGIYFRNMGDYLLILLEKLHLNNEYLVQQIQSLEQLPWDEILTKVVSYFGFGNGNISSMATDVINTTVIVLENAALWLTSFVVSLYLLASKERLIVQFKMIIVAIFGRETSEAIFKFGHLCNDTFRHFIGGQLVEACILFVLYYISMTLFKLPYELLISMLIGITSIIPIFGAMVGALIGCILILAINPLQSLFFFVFYLVVQQIEDNLIYPKVVGNSVGLPGIWVLLSLLIFGSLMGMFGMLIAVPVSAILYQLVKQTVIHILDVRDLVVTDAGNIEDEK